MKIVCCCLFSFFKKREKRRKKNKNKKSKTFSGICESGWGTTRQGNTSSRLSNPVLCSGKGGRASNVTSNPAPFHFNFCLRAQTTRLLLDFQQHRHRHQQQQHRQPCKRRIAKTGVRVQMHDSATNNRDDSGAPQQGRNISDWLETRIVGCRAGAIVFPMAVSVCLLRESGWRVFFIDFASV